VRGSLGVVTGGYQAEGGRELLCEAGGITESHVEVDVYEDRLTHLVESNPRGKDTGELCYRVCDVVRQVADDLFT
jgi:hypothetical protein